MSAQIIDFRAAAAALTDLRRMKSEDVTEALQHVAELTTERNRLMRRRAGELLSEAGCDRGCPICPRECAVTSIMLNWWTRELATLTGGAGGTVH